MNKVIFAERAATVHIKAGDEVTLPDGNLHVPIESRVLAPGETLPLSEVPSYLKASVEKGEAPGLVLLTPNQAKKLQEQAEMMKSQTLAIPDEDIENSEE
jgi:hypothetical protein